MANTKISTFLCSYVLGGNVPTVLHEVTVPIIDKVKCQTMFTKSGHKKIVRDSFLCAGYDEGKRDSCEVSGGQRHTLNQNYNL